MGVILLCSPPLRLKAVSQAPPSPLCLQGPVGFPGDPGPPGEPGVAVSSA